MKKIVSLLWALLFLVSVFTGCQITKPNNPNDTTNSQELSSDSDPFAEFVEESPVSDFEYETNEDNGITITKYIGSDTHVVIPQKIDGKDVTQIGFYAFLSNYTLVSVKMPNSIRIIQECAFRNNSSLVSVILSQNLLSIEDHAFESCSELSSITLPDTLIRIGCQAFSGCSSLKHINIPKNLSDWDEGYTFSTSGLETVDFEEGLETIGYAAFLLTNIKEITLPSTLKEIQLVAFAWCWKLESVILNEGLVTIGEGAFTDNFKLTEIVIPSTVKNLHECAFVGCTNFQKVKFEGDAPEIFLCDNEEIKENRTECLPNFTVFFHKNAKGFTLPEWNGYPTQIW